MCKVGVFECVLPLGEGEVGRGVFHCGLPLEVFMKFRIFAIFDAKAKAYLPPFTLPEVGQAVRTFVNCVNSPDHAFGRNPEDYTLFELGSFDVASGKLVQEEIELIASGLQVREEKLRGGTKLGVVA